MAYKTLHDQPSPLSSLPFWFLLLFHSLSFSHTGLLAVCQLTKHALGLCPSESLRLECSLVPDSFMYLESLLRCHILNGAYPDDSILNSNEPIPPTRNLLPLSSFIFSTSHLLTCYMVYWFIVGIVYLTTYFCLFCYVTKMSRTGIMPHNRSLRNIYWIN